MSNIALIIKKIKIYTRHQGFIDFLTYLIFTVALVCLSSSIALFLLKSPLYGLIGIVPFFFYRRVPFIKRASALEKKADLSGELVNSVQLAFIPPDSKERYSQELIKAFINESAQKIKELDFKKYRSYNLLNRAILFFLVIIAVCLTYPAFLSNRFWYALNHQITYAVMPKQGPYAKGAELNLKLSLFGPYLPQRVDLVTLKDNRSFKERLDVKNGMAQKSIIINKPLRYHFEFFNLRTQDFKLSVIEPIFIKNLQFYLKYPRYTALKNERKTSSQLIAPVFTRVNIKGKTSQALSSARFEFGDTVNLQYQKDEFSGEFVIKKSGTAILHLYAENGKSELKEEITIYSIPDLAPLVDIFYPGYNSYLPQNMKILIGIRCSDDYRLQTASFFYYFKKEYKKSLKLKRNAVEDTMYFDWDLSDLGMLPGMKFHTLFRLRIMVEI